MHELGHSILGFRHSGLGNDVYADTSCYMGYAENEFGSPRKAFVSFIEFGSHQSD